ncbi:MAG: ATP-binding protein [Phenylobacterium sp.]|uniref:hybrid sensor histidine kinase/response regulator n=1 Tax=Phenylobacterium sp. TaxID=1871053 RepID=UPI00391ABC02
MAALALGAITVFLGSLFLLAGQIDAGVRRHEEKLVLQGAASRVQEVGRAIVPQTSWDEAVRKLDHRFDAKWAYDNLTVYTRQLADLEWIFVLDANDRPIYASHEDRQVSPATYAGFLDLRDLIAEVRRRERARPPLFRPGGMGANDIVANAVQAPRYFVRDGKPYLAIATLVQPDLGEALPRGATAPIVVTALPLDGDALEVMRKRFHLENARMTVGHRPLPKGDAAVSIESPSHVPITLAWTPEKPGLNMLARAAPAVGVVLLAFAVVAAIMLGRIRAAAMQLVASHRAQSEFLANMSHEIRTPLNGVSAIAEALERTPLSPDQAEMVGIIRGSGATLERLLSDVLDLSRIETGAVEMHEEAFHLGEAIRAVAALAGARAQEKGVDLILDIDPAVDTPVLGDVVRLKQVLTNLVSNAVKFTDQGYVAVAARRAPDGRWRLEVQDTGVGFDPADKAKLFARFQQADGSVTRRFGGSGLGLAISRQLVELMGGTIDAVGAPGEGATFTVLLPLPPAEAAPVQAEQAPAATTPERALRVLLADDHPTNRRVVQVLLADLPVEIVAVENGEQACEAFAADAFDLVLMDMQMPVMDGLTATRAIRRWEAARALSPTPVVMLTANALPEHQAASLEAGADLHMTKPIEASKLFAVLREVAQGHPRRRETLAA